MKNRRIRKISPPKDKSLLKKRGSRWCVKCGETIPLNASEIYNPEAINPNPPPFYLELCSKCAKRKIR